MRSVAFRSSSKLFANRKLLQTRLPQLSDYKFAKRAAYSEEAELTFPFQLETACSVRLQKRELVNLLHYLPQGEQVPSHFLSRYQFYCRHLPAFSRVTKSIKAVFHRWASCRMHHVRVVQLTDQARLDILDRKHLGKSLIVQKLHIQASS